ncbi:MAG: hypothetical protein ACYS22_21030, partial [Planctomycetota bacterium]
RGAETGRAWCLPQVWRGRSRTGFFKDTAARGQFEEPVAYLCGTVLLVVRRLYAPGGGPL